MSSYALVSWYSVQFIYLFRIHIKENQTYINMQKKLQGEWLQAFKWLDAYKYNAIEEEWT